jgi:hypothetical protein
MEKVDNSCCEVNAAFIPINFLYHKHDYFVVECSVKNHRNKALLRVSKGNPLGYVKGECMVTKAQYNEWFNTDYDEEERQVQLWYEFAESIPLLIEHSEEILSRDDYYFAQTPLSVYPVGRVYIGGLLKGYLTKESKFILPCDTEGCDGKRYIFSFSGSPLTGTMIGHCICPKCGKISKFQNSDFKKLRNFLIDVEKNDKNVARLPLAQSPIQPKKENGPLAIDYSFDEPIKPERMTVHDVIVALKEKYDN